MAFDKSRVYTALNADELKVGSKVIVAFSLETLKEKVQGNIHSVYIEKIKKIEPETIEHRFTTVSDCDDSYALAYLVEPPEEKVLEWTDLKVGDIIKRKDGSMITMVTSIDVMDSDGCHVHTDKWLLDNELENYEKVEE